MRPPNPNLNSRPGSLAGVEQIYGLGDMNDYERNALKAMMPELRASIEKGVKFVQESS